MPQFQKSLLGNLDADSLCKAKVWAQYRHIKASNVAAWIGFKGKSWESSKYTFAWLQRELGIYIFHGFVRTRCGVWTSGPIWFLSPHKVWERKACIVPCTAECLLPTLPLSLLSSCATSSSNYTPLQECLSRQKRQKLLSKVINQGSVTICWLSYIPAYNLPENFCLGCGSHEQWAWTSTLQYSLQYFVNTQTMKTPKRHHWNSTNQKLCLGLCPPTWCSPFIKKGLWSRYNTSWVKSNSSTKAMGLNGHNYLPFSTAAGIEE